MGTLKLLDDAGIAGELVLREVREGRVETAQMWGRPESVRQEFRRSARSRQDSPSAPPRSSDLVVAGHCCLRASQARPSGRAPDPPASSPKYGAPAVQVGATSSSSVDSCRGRDRAPGRSSPTRPRRAPVCACV